MYYAGKPKIFTGSSHNKRLAVSVVVLIFIFFLNGSSCGDSGSSNDDPLSALDTVNVSITTNGTCLQPGNLLSVTVTITGKSTNQPLPGMTVTIRVHAYWRVSCGQLGLPEWSSLETAIGTTNGAGTCVIDVDLGESPQAGADYRYIDYVHIIGLTK